MKSPYVLERTAREFDRLDLQGIIYEDITRRALLDGGLTGGMRVLDVGCGSGDVARIAAEVVGPSGSVVGIDRDEEAVLAARVRAKEQDIKNVVFHTGEIDADTEQGAFDALVGRFVLMHQPRPGRTLVAASRAVRAGGVIVILESQMASLLDGRHSFPWSRLYDDVVRWKCRVVAAAGADIESGLRLRRTFQEAGLPEPFMRMEACLAGGSKNLIYKYMAESIRSMLPMAAQREIDGFTVEEVDTLEARLRGDVVSNDGVIVAWPVVTAWCQLPLDIAQT
jgi:ubiquinone/menaquinone biosynthesis C-methylase UbiE